MAKKKDVIAAVVELKNRFAKEGCTLDDSGVDYTALTAAVNGEYVSGQSGTVVEVIQDLFDSVGSDEFGFKEEG